MKYLLKSGPSTWPNTYSTCAGTSQSPINIVPNSAVPTQLSDFRLTGNEYFRFGLVNSINTFFCLKMHIHLYFYVKNLKNQRLKPVFQDKMTF